MGSLLKDRAKTCLIVYADCISVVMNFFSSLKNITKRLMFVHSLKSLLFPLN